MLNDHVVAEEAKQKRTGGFPISEKGSPLAAVLVEVLWDSDFGRALAPTFPFGALQASRRGAAI